MSSAATVPAAQPVRANGGTEPAQAPATAPDGSQQAGTQTSTPTQGAEAERLAWTERIKRGGDFALETVQKFQSQADQLRGEVERFKKRAGSLSDLLTKDGSGEQIAMLARAADRLSNHPDFADAVLAAAKGLPIPSLSKVKEEPPEEDYRDPEVIALEKKYDDLAQRYDQLAQQSGSVAMTQAKDHAKQVFAQVLGEVDLTEEQRTRVLEVGMADIGNLPPDTIGRLDPNTAKAIVLRSMSWDEIDAARERKRLREQQARGRLATDGPGGVAPTQTEPARMSIRDAVKRGLQEAMTRAGS